MAEWIDVRDRLPEDSESYLVSVKTGGCMVAKYDTDLHRWRTSGTIVITYWMPLPELPEKAAEEAKEAKRARAKTHSHAFKETHPEAYKAARRRSATKFRKRCPEYHARWQRENAEKVREYQRKYAARKKAGLVEPRCVKEAPDGE